MPFLVSSFEKFPAQKRTRSPSGRMLGNRCDRSSVTSTCSVTMAGLLPAALTRHSGPPARCEYAMAFLLPQLAPLAVSVTGTMICAGPPDDLTFIRLPLAKKPTYAASGDQNG